MALAAQLGYIVQCSVSLVTVIKCAKVTSWREKRHNGSTAGKNSRQ